MIDDDEFQKIFRKMMEQFFGTFGMPDGGNRIGGFWENQAEDLHESEMDLTYEGPHIERIDLDDLVILVIGGCANDDITVKVSGSKATLNLGSSTTEHETHFQIDPDESVVSCRNGVAEVKLVKADERSSITNEERVLRNE
ncbi:MAG: hypothetical protein AM324_006600 [Candidatus Thorarchaeota archaeon SMTZ1-83]|nr:MAG: hypothetical protein AM324_07735 [Candidatus Thorarchaeota archaeon SMTZ1-83]